MRTRTLPELRSHGLHPRYLAVNQLAHHAEKINEELEDDIDNISLPSHSSSGCDSIIEKCTSGLVLTNPSLDVFFNGDEEDLYKYLFIDLAICNNEYPAILSQIAVNDKQGSESWYRFTKFIEHEIFSIPFDRMMNDKHNVIQFIPFELPWKEYIDPKRREQAQEYFCQHMCTINCEYNMKPVDFMGSSFSKTALKRLIM